jgi:7-cyano-7-deazaguanine synthase
VFSSFENKKKDENALILFSGGQDSAVCLFYALATFNKVYTVGFNYGQRHSTELTVRRDFLQKIRNKFPEKTANLHEDCVFELKALAQAGSNALTEARQIEAPAQGLPNTFVPGRNLMFFTQGAAYAYDKNIKYLIGGMCETDYSGYPDCRDDSLKALQVALNLGMEADFVIETPLMRVNKAHTWKMTEFYLGAPGVEFLVEHTHSCYIGVRDKRHDWGYGCGECPACKLRSTGYYEFVNLTA